MGHRSNDGQMLFQGVMNVSMDLELRKEIGINDAVINKNISYLRTGGQ